MAEGTGCFLTQALDRDPIARTSVRSIMTTENLACFALDHKCAPSSWTAYFAWDGIDQLTILTDPYSRHGQRLAAGTLVAGCVWKRVAEWGEPICGLQFIGRLLTRTQDELARIYAGRFSGYARWRDSGGTTASRFFAVKLEWIKVIDECSRGEEVFREFGRRPDE